MIPSSINFRIWIQLDWLPTNRNYFWDLILACQALLTAISNLFKIYTKASSHQPDHYEFIYMLLKLSVCNLQIVKKVHHRATVFLTRLTECVWNPGSTTAAGLKFGKVVAASVLLWSAMVMWSFLMLSVSFPTRKVNGSWKSQASRQVDVWWCKEGTARVRAA